MSHDPYPSYQAPPPSPYRPPAGPVVPPGEPRHRSGGAQWYPVDGGRFPAHGERFPAHGERFPAQGERFPQSGAPFSAGGGRVPAGEPVSMYEEAFPASAPAASPAEAPTPGALAGRPRAGRQADGLAPLRAAYARQRRAAGATVLGFFSLYVLLAVYVPSVPNAGPDGGPSLGIVLGLLQLPVTVAALVVHERAALRRVDPLVEQARASREERR